MVEFMDKNGGMEKAGEHNKNWREKIGDGEKDDLPRGNAQLENITSFNTQYRSLDSTLILFILFKSGSVVIIMLIDKCTLTQTWLTKRVV